MNDPERVNCMIYMYTNKFFVYVKCMVTENSRCTCSPFSHVWIIFVIEYSDTDVQNSHMFQ